MGDKKNLLIDIVKKGYSFSISKIDWDSKIFSNQTFDLQNIKIKIPGVKADFKKIARTKRGDLIIAKIDYHDNTAKEFLLSNGFYYVEKISSLKLAKSDFVIDHASDHNARLRRAVKNDIARIKEIANNSIEISHYHADKNLDKKLSSYRFSYWVQNSFERKDDDIWVLLIHKDIVGFCIMRNGGDKTRLLLIAMSKDYQGRGYGKNMLVKVMKKYLSMKKEVVTDVYTSNVAAMSYYLSFGFKAVNETSIYHYFEK